MIERILPSLQYSLLCEKMIQDELGRPVAVGLFNEIRHGSTPFTFKFFVSNGWTNGIGVFRQHTSLYGPDGTLLLASQESEFYLGARARSHRVDERFTVQVREPGRHQVRVYLESDVRLEYYFMVNVAPHES